MFTESPNTKQHVCKKMAESYQNTSFSNEDLQNTGVLAKKNIADLKDPQTEKPFHYRYLKEFRVEQCQLFLQHKCTQHRPFTCFNWHFLNQKRRRPKKKKDGTFNYSPDEYCTSYNETTGECQLRDECPHLHRVAGDVERRYHLRYYKTSPCVHETDSRGFCVKNGAHCAFAHGPADLRQPVYDIREIQAMELEDKGESKQIVPEDPRWNDTNFVLAAYKTEPCKKPPRLCRQGYACPQHHNNRDRRRSPRKYKYRSTPCPNVKHGDEWGDPNACENGDSCQYCHTRTEQQFHPEIYKSTKCNDMQQTGCCPRGPFCAFAHPEQDAVTAVNAVSRSGGISIISDKDLLQRGLSQSSQHSSVGESPLPSPASQGPIARPQRSMSTSSCMAYSSVAEHGLSCSLPLSSSAPTYEKAPGSGRRSSSITSKDGDHLGTIYQASSESRSLSKQSSTGSSSFYPNATTIESVVGNALDDWQLGRDEIDVAELDRELNDNGSIDSSIGSGALDVLQAIGSDPVSIPGAEILRHQSFTSQTSTSPTSPLGQLGFFAQTQNHISYMRSPSGKNSGTQSSSFFDGMNVQSPKQQMTSPLGLSSGTDTQRLSEEVVALRSKLSSYEQSWNQAKQACEAWKREANEKSEKCQAIDRDRMMLKIKLGEAETELRNLRHEIEARHGGPHIYSLKSVSELNSLSTLELKQIQKQLKVDIDRVERIICKKESMLCTLCEKNQRSSVTYPCSHCVMCDACCNKRDECPFCHVTITGKNIISIPI